MAVSCNNNNKRNIMVVNYDMMEKSRTMKSLKNIMMGFASKVVILIMDV